MKKIYLVSLIIAVVAFIGVAYLLTSQEIASDPSFILESEEIAPIEDRPSLVAGNTLEETIEQEVAVVETSNASKLHFCNRSPELKFSSMLCYTAKPGDTLWGIAERYLGTGFRWGKLHDGPPRNGEYEWNPETRETVYVGYSRLKDPATQLWPGMEVGMHTSSMLPLDLEADADRYFVETSKLSLYNDDLLIVVNTRLSNQKLVYLNGERYDERTYRDISHINFSNDGTRITYIAKNGWDKCEILVDLVAYEFTCGNDIQDPIFSPNGEHFVFRTNFHNPGVWTGSDKFYVVSDLGNGSYYDFVDSLMWIDDETFVYRAQTNDEWRVVANHEDLIIYDYLENLKVKNGLITFDTRHQVESWTKEVIDLNGK